MFYFALRLFSDPVVALVAAWVFEKVFGTVVPGYELLQCLLKLP